MPVSTALRMILSLAFGLWAGTASAATVVHIDLWDKGAGTPMASDLAYPAAPADISRATMGMTLSKASAPAGVVTFQVKNTSKDTVHEMIVMYMADPSKALPYIAAETRVDEDKAGDKGEVSELDPGATGALTVVLKPGKYLLICNVPGHYSAGMWAPFEVTK